jgi:hypothetical protein
MCAGGGLAAGVGVGVTVVPPAGVGLVSDEPAEPVGDAVAIATPPARSELEPASAGASGVLKLSRSTSARPVMAMARAPRLGMSVSRDQ